METIRAIAVFLVERVLYPGVVTLVIGFLLVSGALVVARERSGRGFMASMASAALPALVLIFLVSMMDTGVPSGLLWFRSVFGFVIGAALALAVLEVRKRLPAGGVYPLFYIMSVFSLASAIIYFFLANAFGLIEPAIAGFALAGCAHFIYRRLVSGGD